MISVPAGVALIRRQAIPFVRLDARFGGILGQPRMLEQKWLRPSLNCAPASPWRAAFWNHVTDWASSRGTPWPASYMTPRLY